MRRLWYLDITLPGLSKCYIWALEEPRLIFLRLAASKYRTPTRRSSNPPLQLLALCRIFASCANNESIQPGSIVINAGDLLARWSNDVLRSTLHRVVAPPAKKVSETEGITPKRQSIAFFCNPNFDALISCLPNCGKEAKYAPVTTEDYIVGRLSVTYT